MYTEQAVTFGMHQVHRHAIFSLKRQVNIHASFLHALAEFWWKGYNIKCFFNKSRVFNLKSSLFSPFLILYSVTNYATMHHDVAMATRVICMSYGGQVESCLLGR